MKLLNFKKKSVTSFIAFFSASFSLTSPIGAIISWLIFPILLLLVDFKKNINPRKIIFFAILFITIISINSFSYEFSSYKDRFFTNISLAIIGLAISLYSLNTESIKKMEFILDKIILIHILLFLIQFISYYLLKINIDYNLLSGGTGSRNDWGSLYRASGIYDEPAVFCMHMTALIVLRVLISKDNILICNLALICMCLSFSFVGIFQSFFLFILISKSFDYKKIFAIFIILFASFFNIFANRLNQFINGEDGSNNTKISVLYELFDNINLINYGYGFVGYRHDYPLHYQGIYDLTFFGANVTIYGLYLGALINFLFLFLFFKSKFSFKEKLMIFLVLLKISTPTFMIYWFFLLGLFFINKNRILMNHLRAANITDQRNRCMSR